MLRTALLFTTGLLVTLLSACLPAVAGTRPEVVLLNGPREAFVLEAGVTLQRLADDAAPLPFTVVGNTTARFLETSRGIAGRSAPEAAARVADQLGAAGAVLIGVPIRDRGVEVSRDGSTRSVEVTVQVRALVLSAAGGEPLATVLSRTYSGQRDEPTDTPLVELDADPTVAALTVVAVEDTATAIFDAVARTISLP